MSGKDSAVPYTKDVGPRNASFMEPIEIPKGALREVKMGEYQCFFCGNFGHALRGCPSAGNYQTAQHWNNWRKVKPHMKAYSTKALWPDAKSFHKQRPSQSTPSSSQKVSAAAATWSAEGNLDTTEEVDAEYLCDGGTTASVSNKLSLLLNYTPFSQPIPLETAAHGSDAVLLGKGHMNLPTNEGGQFTLREVYYCPKERETLISQGAFIQQGAQ